MPLKLYSYWRSTTSYCVRIALNLKGLDYEIQPIDLVAGEQRNANFAALNPGMGVPVLEIETGQNITQSLAILDYLEAVALPPLLPEDPGRRARIVGAASVIATDVHPVSNLRVMQKLAADFGVDIEMQTKWRHHWLQAGFQSFSELIDSQGQYCFGDTVSWADLCLVSQAYNVHRWGLGLDAFPRLKEIEARCLKLDAFASARPENQPDASLPS